MTMFAVLVLLTACLKPGEGRIFPSEVGSGWYDDSVVYDGFGNQRPAADHRGSVTTTFLDVERFVLEDGTGMKYPNNVVSRLVDYNGDGRMDLLAAAQGRVYLHIQQANGKMSLGTPLKTKSGDIDTGDRSGRYTGFAFMDLNGDGFKDIILSKGYNQDLVYYPGKPYECKIADGEDYVGMKNTTVSGRTCQRWDSQSPHRHTRNNPVDFPDVTLEGAGNRCRNPDGEPKPWCYTTDSGKRWEYCNVPDCQETLECKMSRRGKDYMGSRIRTGNNHTCQRWDSQTPNSHTHKNRAKFPDDTLGDAGNKCRNPDNEPLGPWCYTVEGPRWEYCDITPCGSPEYGEAIPLNIQTNYMRFDVADWDNDGDLDVIVGHRTVMLYKNEGSRTTPQFSQTVKSSISMFGSRTYSRYPRVMDIDKDGKLDLVESINWGYFTLSLHGPKGRFIPIKLRVAMGDVINTRRLFGEHQAMDLNDVNGDGILDLVTSGDKGDVLFFKGVKVMDYVMGKIEKLIDEYPTNLGYILNNNDSVYNKLYDGNKNIQDLVNLISTPKSIKDKIYYWYKSQAVKHPRYYTRQLWGEGEPCLAQFAGYMWNIMWETREKSDRATRIDLATVTNQTGIYRDIFVNRSIFYIDNNKATSPKAEWLYQFLMKKDPTLYSLAYMTHRSYFLGRNHKYGCQRDSCVNVAGWETYAYNQFPDDCVENGSKVCTESGRSPAITNYIVIVAHEVAHNEADQELAEAWNFNIFRRKYRLIQKGVESHVIWKTNPEEGYDKSATKTHFKNKGWWDGVEDWDTAAKRHFSTGLGSGLNFNMIRNNIWFFVKAPQEAFATLANQYFSDSKLMLDFAIDRAKRGHQLNVDWFLLIADYYSKGGSTFPMYQIGKMHLNPNIVKYEASLQRNNDGFITKIMIDKALNLPGPTNYTCSLNEEGLTTMCTTA